MLQANSFPTPCRGRQLGDPSGAAAHLRMEQSRTLNGTSSRNCPLACTVHRNALLRGRRVAKLATPTEHGESRRCIPFIPRHSLSFAFAQQLPQRGSQGHFVPGELRVAKLATPTEYGGSRGMQRGRTPYAECALVTAAPSCSADIHFNRRK